MLIKDLKMKLIVKKLIIMISIQSVLLCSELNKLDIACKIGKPAVCAISTYFIQKELFTYSKDHANKLRNDRGEGLEGKTEEEQMQMLDEVIRNITQRENNLDSVNYTHLLKSAGSHVLGFAVAAGSLSYGAAALRETIKYGCQLI